MELARREPTQRIVIDPNATEEEAEEELRWGFVAIPRHVQRELPHDPPSREILCSCSR